MNLSDEGIDPCPSVGFYGIFTNDMLNASEAGTARSVLASDSHGTIADFSVA